jgi:hypothetical protein
LSPNVSREHAWNKFGSALRLYVGRGRRYTVKQLANATGVKDRVIECAMTAPDSVDFRPMPLEAILSIAAFLGADFTNEWLHLAGQGAFELPDEDEPLPGQFAADVVGDGAEVARRAADGEFCTNDRQALRVVGQRKIERGMQLVAMAERPRGRRAA